MPLEIRRLDDQVRAAVEEGEERAEVRLRLAQQEPNVYLDLSSSVGKFGAFAALVNEIGSHKLIYGSDAPVICFTFQIGRVLFAPIAEGDKRMILGTNMAGLLATRR